MTARDAEPTVWGRLLGGLLRATARVGVDPPRMQRALGLDDHAFADPDARVPLRALYEMLELCAAWSGDPLCALELAREFDPASLDALGFLALTSATLGDALDATVRYQRVFAEGERYTLVRAEGRTAVRLYPWGPARPGHHAWADLFARDVGVNMLALVGGAPEGAAVRVRLRRPAPKEVARYASALGVTPEFGALVDEVSIPDAVLAAPVPRADATLAAFFERYLDERLSRLPPESVTARAAAHIDALLPGGGATLDAVATRMHLSGRTLQRRLTEAGASFAELLDERRRARTLSLLDAGVALSEVAWLTGYSEASAFHRAFVRWKGETPSAWRARRAG